MAETAFGIGAFCVAAAIIGGGLKAAHIWELPALESVGRQFMLGAFGVILIVLGVAMDGGLPWAPGRAASTPVPGTATATSTPGSTSTTSPGTPTATATGTAPSTAGCQVTIGNPLATMREQPANQAQEVQRVPAGTYEVTDVRTVTFAGRDERWFEITANGRNGWIKDDTFTIASKSAGCP